MRVAAVSIVVLETARQVWPAESPYAFPVGPDAPVSDMPQVVLSSSRLVLASRAA